MGLLSRGDGVPKEEDLLLLTPLSFNICKLWDSFLLLFQVIDFLMISCALHLVGGLSHCERKLITWRWGSKGRRLAFVDSSSFQHLQTIGQLSFAFQVIDFLMFFSVVYVVFYVEKCYTLFIIFLQHFHNKFQMTSFNWLLLVSKKIILMMDSN